MSCLVCDGTQVAPDGKPCWSCIDDVTPPPTDERSMAPMSKAIPCPKGCGATVYVPAYEGDGAYGPDTLETHVCRDGDYVGGPIGVEGRPQTSPRGPAGR